VDTLFGLNIIGKAMFTVRGRTRTYACACAFEEALAIPSPFLTDASEKFHGDEIFCCGTEMVGLYPLSPKRWWHTPPQAEGSAHRGWIARRAKARRTSVFGFTVERGFRFRETPGSLTS
jgi:hypothetical protein